MRPLVLLCLVLTGCATAELTQEGARVGVTRDAQQGCRLVGTVREAEGGGFRTLEDNTTSVETILRNQAAWLGGDTVMVVSTNTDPFHMPSGVPGITNPNAACSNCVTMTARVYQCGHPAAPSAPAAPTCPSDPTAPGDDAPPSYSE